MFILILLLYVKRHTRFEPGSGK